MNENECTEEACPVHARNDVNRNDEGYFITYVGEYAVATDLDMTGEELMTATLLAGIGIKPTNLKWFTKVCEVGYGALVVDGEMGRVVYELTHTDRDNISQVHSATVGAVQDGSIFGK